MTLAEQARPLIDDWAADYGVTIEFVHEWAKDATRRVTAFGYDNSGGAMTSTIVVPARIYPFKAFSG